MRVEPHNAGAWPVTFRLACEPGSRCYVRVHVWPSVRAMLRAAKADGHRVNRPVRGSCMEVRRIVYRPGKPARFDGAVARVHLACGWLGMELVTHEMFHATMAWARRAGFDFARLRADDSVNEAEERLTYVHGRLCAQLVGRLYARKLYDVRTRDADPA